MTSEVIEQQWIDVDGWRCWDYHLGPTPDRDGNLWIWQEITGWFGGLSVRAAPVARPMSDGDYDGPATFGGRTVQIDGTLIAPDRNKLQYGMDELARVLATRTRVATMYVNEGQRHLERTLRVRLAGPTLIKRTGPVTAEFSISFYSPDPLRYSVTEHSVALLPYSAGEGRRYNLRFNRIYGALGSSGRATIFNTGNAPTPSVITFIGPSVNPSLRVVGGDQTALLMEIMDGQRVTIDSAARTVILTPGDVSRRAQLTPDSRWLTFDPPATDVFYQTDSGKGLCNVAWRDAWS